MSTAINSPQQIENRLTQMGNRVPSIRSLVEIYQQDKSFFFDFAVVGVRDGAEPWQRELSELAVRLSELARRGFQVVDGPGGLCSLLGGTTQITVDPSEVHDAELLLRELRGTAESNDRPKDLVGAPVGESEILFKLGPINERSDAGNRLSKIASAKPTVLRVDEQDIVAIQHGMPAYVVYELLQCAARTIENPTVVFEGTRAVGRLASGRAYCGKPKRAFNNAGAAVAPPAGMVYCVYVDPEGFVFDWDWVREDAATLGYPVGYERRFNSAIDTNSEFVLALPKITPSAFKKSKAWHSSRGDCMFFYAADSPAYANRINNDLTEYRSQESDQLVGCKIKNFDAILSKVAETDGSTIPVGAILAASLIRQLEDHQRWEKELFLRAFAAMNEEHRGKFLQSVFAIDSSADDYVDAICNLALEFSDSQTTIEIGRRPPGRQEIQKVYFQLINAAGSTQVETRRAAAA